MNELDTGFAFRSDGREPAQMREIEFTLGVSAFRRFDGSAYFRQGLTQVIVFVEGPRSVR